MRDILMKQSIRSVSNSLNPPRGIAAIGALYNFSNDFFDASLQLRYLSVVHR